MRRVAVLALAILASCAFADLSGAYTIAGDSQPVTVKHKPAFLANLLPEGQSITLFGVIYTNEPDDSKCTLEHEAVHVEQQRKSGDMLKWLISYVLQPEFRHNAEFAAYANQAYCYGLAHGYDAFYANLLGLDASLGGSSTAAVAAKQVALEAQFGGLPSVVVVRQ